MSAAQTGLLFMRPHREAVVDDLAMGDHRPADRTSSRTRALMPRKMKGLTTLCATGAKPGAGG